MDPAILVSSVLVLAAIWSTRFSQRFGLPALVLFVAIGMLAGSGGPGGIEFDDYRLSHEVGLLALAIILFSGGLDTDRRLFRTSLLPSAMLATVGVILKMLVVGLFAWWISPLGPLEGMLLGAVLAPTDAAATFSVLKGRGLPRRLRGVLETESGTNDPMSVYLTTTLAAMATTGALDVGGAVLGILVQLVVGAFAGIAGGRALVWLVNRAGIASFGLYPLLALAGALIVYAGTNLIGGNGFLAVYLTGLAAGNRPLVHGHAIKGFMDAAAWGAQIVMFLLLGLLAIPGELLTHLPFALVVTAVLMLVARPVSVWLSLLPVERVGRRYRFSPAEKILISWAGLKGAVPIILASVPLLEAVPNGDLMFNVVFVVVVFGTTLQGLTIVPLARRLRLLRREPPEPPIRLELGGAAPPGSGAFDVFLHPDAPAVGRTIEELDLPDEVVVAALARGGRMITPRGNVRFESGDHVYVITTDRENLRIPEFRSASRSASASVRRTDEPRPAP